MQNKVINISRSFSVVNQRFDTLKFNQTTGKQKFSGDYTKVIVYDSN